MEKSEKPDSKELGKIKKVDLREIWEDEARDFTPWIAENIDLLGEAIGIEELEVEQKEKSVGPFNADILARNTETGDYVVIENQLEHTNHKHMGQLMTYLVGLDALIVVWVAKKFQEEHRAVLDWLNDITDERYRFFGLEVELLQIEVKPAPNFNIVSAPNGWSREAKASIRKESPEAVKFRLRYWEHFIRYLDAHNISGLARPTPPKNNRMNFYGTGRGGFNFAISVRVNQPRIGCSFEAKNEMSEPMFRFLNEKKSEIEKEIGMSLDLTKEDKSTAISTYDNDVKPKDEDGWEEQFKWFVDTFQKFDRVFGPLVRDFNPQYWQEPDDYED